MAGENRTADLHHHGHRGLADAAGGGGVVIALSGGAGAASAPAASGGRLERHRAGAWCSFFSTYGGWNEAAYLSAELRDGKRNIVRVLVLSIVAVTALYFLVAWAYLYVMGFEGLQKFQRHRRGCDARRLRPDWSNSDGAVLSAGPPSAP